MKREKFVANEEVRDQVGDYMLTVDEVCQILRVGRAHVYSCVKEGRLPQPVKMGRSSRWWKSEILQTGRAGHAN